jgi:hypothetical protein
MRQNPYNSLPESAFWATAVARRHMLDIRDLWQPAHPILATDKVATFGSCFAQHFGSALRERGFSWHITERAPQGLSAENARRFNYEVFTCRTGNIYTASLLSQWLSWADGAPAPDVSWEEGNRFYDPFRPVVEPDGFASHAEMLVSRERTIKAFRRAVTHSEVFVFTLGLTESWFDSRDGFEYPMCPGTSAGTFDSQRHQFVNQDFPAIRQALNNAIRHMRRINPRLRILLTVSPVPLTATMSGKHVLVATMESKSILRAVAAHVASQFTCVEYFPSYEIINSPAFKGMFFEPNQRNVNPSGVRHVMDSFFSCLAAKYPEASARPAPGDRNKRDDANPRKSADAVCEEELLGSFAPGQKGGGA